MPRLTRLLLLALPAAAIVAALLHATEEDSSAWTQVGSTESISGRERAEPTLCLDAEGRVAVVTVSHALTVGDRLDVHTSDATLTTAHSLGGVRELLQPTSVTRADGEQIIVATTLVDGMARLMLSETHENGWRPLSLLETPASPSLDPRLACGGSHVWLVWRQATPDTKGYALWAASLNERALGPPVEVAPAPCEPADIVCDDDGSLTVTWASFADGDFDVHLRHVDTNGEITAPVHVSRDDRADDVHPSLARTATGVWVVWDRIEDPRRGSSMPKVPLRGRPEGATIELVFVDDEGAVHQPTAKNADPRAGLSFSWSGGRPRVAAGPDGRIHIVARHLDRRGDNPKVRSHAYPLAAWSLGPDGWSAAEPLDGTGGGSYPIAAFATSAGWWVASQTDGRAEQQKTALRTPVAENARAALDAQGLRLSGFLGPSRVVLHRRAWSTPTSGTIALDPRIVREQEPETIGDARATALVDGSAHHVIDAGRKQYTVYWGDLHRHSSESRCTDGQEADLLDRYAFAREVYRDDFLAITDHSGSIDAFQWWRQCKAVDLYHSPTFCVLQGFEWSSSNFGHLNVIFGDRVDRIVSLHHEECKTPDGLWSLLNAEECLAIPHHTSEEEKAILWSECDPAFVRLVEVYQAQRGNFEFPGCYRQGTSARVEGSWLHDGLDRGLKVGLVASSDHGYGASYAAVLAESLTRDSIFEALRARRTYGATAKGFLVDFRIDDKLMGQTVRSAGALEVTLEIDALTDIAEVIIFRNGHQWQSAGRDPAEPGRQLHRKQLEPVDLSTGLGSSTFSGRWTDDRPLGGRSWYYARVVRTDGEAAWSSPIFVRAGRASE